MPGAPLNLDLPVAGDAWATWKSKIEAAFADIEADLEAPVLFSEISATSTLNCNNQAISNLKYLQFYLGNSTAIPVRGIGFKDGEFYITDAAGNSIQVTNGGVLNYAATGGFVGEYVSAGAQASFVNATDLYEFKNEAGAAYADIRLDDLFVSNSTTAYCQIGFGGSSNISLLLPTALPGSTGFMFVDNVGQISGSATVSFAPTFSSNVTLSGSRILHGDRTTGMCASALLSSDRAAAGLAFVQDAVQETNDVDLWFSVPVQTNQRLKSVKVFCNKGNTDSMWATLYRGDGTSAAKTTVATSAVNTSSGNTSLTATIGAPAARTAGQFYSLNVVCTTASTNVFYEIEWVYDEA